MKGVIELTRAKKALSQAVLLLSGAIMLGFGAMRGETETVLNKAIRLVDKNGNIVGEPIVGAITEKNQAKTLEKLIDQALQVK